MTTDEERERRRQHQLDVLKYLRIYRSEGLTWYELDNISGWKHHGTTTGALSSLHKEGRISCLKNVKRRRDKHRPCHVYVLNEFVLGRETRPYGRKAKPCENCGHYG